VQRPSPETESWRDKTIDDVLCEQQHTQPALDQLIGQGRDFWDSDKDLDHFLAAIHELCSDSEHENG